MKLELKHIAPYLPYGLKVTTSFGALTNENTFTLAHDFQPNNLNVISLESVMLIPNEHKPILRPLSDLTKEIEVNGERVFVNEKMITHGFHHSFWYELDKFDYRYLYAHDLEKLLELHFDVFGLIEQGLAIDINTLNP